MSLSLYVIYESKSINDAFALMQKENVTALPIIDLKKVLKGLS